VTRPSASAIAVSTDWGQAQAQVFLHHEPVYDDLDRVLELLVQRGRFLELVLLAVDLERV